MWTQKERHILLLQKKKKKLILLLQNLIPRFDKSLITALENPRGPLVFPKPVSKMVGIPQGGKWWRKKREQGWWSARWESYAMMQLCRKKLVRIHARLNGHLVRNPDSNPPARVWYRVFRAFWGILKRNISWTRKDFLIPKKIMKALEVQFLPG